MTARRRAVALAIPLLVAWSTVASAETPPAAAPPVAPAPTLGARLDAEIVASGLTAAEVGRRAAATSYDAAMRKAEIDAAAAAVDQAYVTLFPRLSGALRYQRLSAITPPVFLPGMVGIVVAQAPQGPIAAGTPLFSSGPVTFPVLLNQTTLTASLSVPVSDYVLRATQGLAAARHSRESAALAERAARLKAGADGQALYYNWVRARLGAVVAEAALGQARAHLVDAEHAFQAGMVSKADVMRVASQVAQTELLVSRSRGLADLLEDAVRTAMHESGFPRYAVGEDVRVDLPPLADDRDPSTLFREAMTTRLELRSLGEAVTSLRNQATVARAGAYPRVDLFGDLLYANPNPRFFPQTDEFHFTWDVGGMLSWSPNDVGVAVEGGKGLDAQGARLEAQKNQIVDGVRAEVFAAWQALRDAEAALGSTARGLSAAEESYRVRRELFQFGKATSVELTDAETELTRARLDALNARIDLRVARVRLLHATGRDLQDAR